MAEVAHLEGRRRTEHNTTSRVVLRTPSQSENMMVDDKKAPNVESSRTTIRSGEVQVPKPTIGSQHTTEDVVDQAQKKGDTPDKAAKDGLA